MNVNFCYIYVILDCVKGETGNLSALQRLWDGTTVHITNAVGTLLDFEDTENFFFFSISFSKKSFIFYNVCQGTGSSSVENELAFYVNITEIGMTATTDVLKYWREWQSEMPHLANLARYIFCIPTTSGSTEKFIVTPGDVINPVRALVDSDDAEKIIFCRQNYFQLKPFLSSWKLDFFEHASDSDDSGSSLSDSDLQEKRGNSYIGF